MTRHRSSTLATLGFILLVAPVALADPGACTAELPPGAGAARGALEVGGVERAHREVVHRSTGLVGYPRPPRSGRSRRCFGASS